MIKIAIASHKDFCKKTLPVIIPSLVDSGIKKEDINVFIAGCDFESVGVKDDVVYRCLNYNMFEMSPLVSIVERKLESEYWFLVHDTCKVGLRFKELLYNIPQDKPAKLALRSSPSMCIGSYRYDYLLSLSDTLSHMKSACLSHGDIQTTKSWAVANEDLLLWKTSPSPVFYNSVNSVETLPSENWFGTGTQRIVEYFPSLDLYKCKSNWRVTPKWEVNL